MVRMRSCFCIVVLSGFLLSCATSAQVKKITEPAGKTLDKALKASLLIQPDARPFHVKLQIARSKTDSTEYDAVIEETWVSPTRWNRTVTAKGLSQTTVVNDTGTHIVTSGDYFPRWLRDFVTALFTPVPNADEWNRSIALLEHIELPNGGRSDPCQHAELNLGTPPIQQVNFADVCFKDGLLVLVVSPSYAMEFKDYASYGKLRVARTLVDHPVSGVELIGRVVTLDQGESADPKLFETPIDASDKDPLFTASISASQLALLANGATGLPWPNPTPGKGMFTVWVSLDRNGKVREVRNLNSD